MTVTQGFALILLGVIVALWGLMMPDVVEVVGTSCYTDAWGYQHCAEAVGQRDNWFRSVVILGGVVSVIAGIYAIE